MGWRQWLDALMGRTRLAPPRPDQLFGLVTARHTLEEALGWEPTGAAGICLKPVATAAYAEAQQELAELVRLGARETQSRVQVERDSYGYTWVLLEDPHLEDLVTLAHMAVQALEEKGFGTQILSAVFRFRPGPRLQAGDGPPMPSRLYLIYNYKRGVFYPFLPRGADARSADGRMESGELQAAAVLGRELPVEQDPARWYPVWECPV